MAKQLIFYLSFVLFLVPPPALGNYYSNCTVGDSPGKASCIIVCRDLFKVCRVTFYDP